MASPTDYDVGEAALLASPQDLLGGRPGVGGQLQQRVRRAQRAGVGVGRRHERGDGIADHGRVERQLEVGA
ncbi:hypothetical protein [Isoptericola sp. QY 916]|uniref:hypothetical protein n=1 Tax=Isoptericola sp. QY 916 TaxID=2782570 RepID=UPI003D2FE915|nr:hypothetical protein [Isoptericola sp. QY 916]